MAQADRVLSTPPTNTSEKPSASGAPQSSSGELYYPTDISPEDLLKALERLRREAKDEIKRLIDLLDLTDDYVTGELEDDGDQLDASYPEGGALLVNPHEDAEDDGTDEPILGSVANQAYWSAGVADDREGDPGCDDREGDELEHGGDEHDGAEPDEDGEPSLGWTVNGNMGSPSAYDREMEDCRPSGKMIEKKWDLYRQRTYHPNRDGMHVDAEQGWGDRKELRNLSDRQRELMEPLIDRAAVTIK